MVSGLEKIIEYTNELCERVCERLLKTLSWRRHWRRMEDSADVTDLTFSDSRQAEPVLQPWRSTIADVALDMSVEYASARGEIALNVRRIALCRSGGARVCRNQKTRTMQIGCDFMRRSATHKHASSQFSAAHSASHCPSWVRRFMETIPLKPLPLAWKYFVRASCRCVFLQWFVHRWVYQGSIWQRDVWLFFSQPLLLQVLCTNPVLTNGYFGYAPVATRTIVRHSTVLLFGSRCIVPQFR